MIKFNVSLIDSDTSIRKNILEALRSSITITINRSIPVISQKIKEIVQSAIKSEPEYASLTNGELRYHFGIANIDNVDNVIAQLINTLNIIAQPIVINNKGLSGGFTLTMINSNNFDGVLDSDAAKVVDNDRGDSLPWLEWLLLRKNEILVKKYEVQMGPNVNSRTGNAIMIKSNDSWRVPAQFVGSKENNWITRALERTDKEITNTIQNTIMVNL